jgi:two-component system cell cycle response regulator CtrA
MILESTATIAEAIGRELRKSRIEYHIADLRDVEEVTSQPTTAFDDYDGIIIGNVADPLVQVTALRNSGVACAVLCLLDFRCTASTVNLLRAGADDVLVKPINGSEVSARIEAARRRAHGHTTNELRVGRLTVFLDGRDPEVGGVRLRLSHREHAIFTVLALNHRRVVSKERVYDAVYGMSNSDPLDKVIDVYICKLRKKILQATGSKYIETVYGRGYKLEAPPEHEGTDAGLDLPLADEDLPAAMPGVFPFPDEARAAAFA